MPFGPRLISGGESAYLIGRAADRPLSAPRTQGPRYPDPSSERHVGSRGIRGTKTRHSKDLIVSIMKQGGNCSHIFIHSTSLHSNFVIAMYVNADVHVNRRSSRAATCRHSKANSKTNHTARVRHRHNHHGNNNR